MIFNGWLVYNILFVRVVQPASLDYRNRTPATRSVSANVHLCLSFRPRSGTTKYVFVLASENGFLLAPLCVSHVFWLQLGGLKPLNSRSALCFFERIAHLVTCTMVEGACDCLKETFIHVYRWHNPYTQSPTPSSHSNYCNSISMTQSIFKHTPPA